MFKLVAGISKLFATLIIMLEFPALFVDLTKLFSDLYLTKFLDFSKLVLSVYFSLFIVYKFSQKQNK